MVRGYCRLVFDVTCANPEANREMCVGDFHDCQHDESDMLSGSEAGFVGFLPVGLATLIRLTRHESVEWLFVGFLL